MSVLIWAAVRFALANVSKPLVLESTEASAIARVWMVPPSVNKAATETRKSSAEAL